MKLLSKGFRAGTAIDVPQSKIASLKCRAAASNDGEQSRAGLGDLLEQIPDKLNQELSRRLADLTVSPWVMSSLLGEGDLEQRLNSKRLFVANMRCVDLEFLIGMDVLYSSKSSTSIKLSAKSSSPLKPSSGIPVEATEHALGLRKTDFMVVSRRSVKTNDAMLE